MSSVGYVLLWLGLFSSCCLLTPDLLLKDQKPGRVHLQDADRAELLAAARQLMADPRLHAHYGEPSRLPGVSREGDQPLERLPSCLRALEPERVTISGSELRLIWHSEDNPLGYGLVLLPEGDDGRQHLQQHGLCVGYLTLEPGILSFFWAPH